nr:unnamed protein product [Digitaria exilis]
MASHDGQEIASSPPEMAEQRGNGDESFVLHHECAHAAADDCGDDPCISLSAVSTTVSAWDMMRLKPY